MTREEFSTLVKGMKAVYTQPTFIPDKDAFDVWYSMLKDMDYKLGSLAITSYMMSEVYPPTIADIRVKALAISSKDKMTDAEAWSLVRKAICDSTYHSQERFDELPEKVKRAVGSADQLRVWATDSSYNDSVIQSNFYKNYRTETKRENDIAVLPSNVQTAISSICDKLMIGEK